MASGQRVTRRWIGAAAVLGLGLVASVTAVTFASPASAATDLAIGKPTTADSTEAGRPASLATDGNAATRWCAADAATGHWLQVDLGSTADISSTQVVWEFARNYRYRVAVSTDGTAWTTVADRSSHTGTAQSVTDTFTAKARFVRVTVTGLAPGSWASIQSFSVFGTGGPEPVGQPHKGLAGPACADVKRLNLAWYYNWWISPGCAEPGFVPTISGKPENGKPKTNGDIQWAMDQVKRAGYKTVLGFNEPNKADQTNMTVARAIELWPILTADSSIRVSSPSTSADSNGQAWFADFLRQAEARKLRVDFLNVHWYGWSAGSCDAEARTFENYLRWAESFPGNRPIWITEFGCMHQSNPNPAAVQAFYTAALKVIARHPRVERHAWYPYLPNNAVVTGGALTSLGTTVANAPKYR